MAFLSSIEEIKAQQITNNARETAGSGREVDTDEIPDNLSDSFEHYFGISGEGRENNGEGSFLERELSQIEEGMRPEVRRMLNLKFHNLMRALKIRREILIGKKKRTIEEVKTENSIIIDSRKIIPGEEGIETLEKLRREALRVLTRQELPVAVQERIIRGIKEIGDRIGQKEKELEELRQSSPEAFMGMSLLEIKAYKRQSREGRIIEFPSVKETMRIIRTDLETRGACFLIGETGLGKTEAALHVGRKMGREKAMEQGEEPNSREPILIRAHARMKVQELYGHHALVSEGRDLNVEADFDNLMNDLDKRLERIIERGDLTDDQVSELRTKMLSQLLQTDEHRNTVSRYIEGMAYRAFREGRILIIDEATFLDSSLLASLNRILNIETGETLDIQEDGDNPKTRTITKKDGFGIIFTGNIGRKYQNRQEFDPPFRDRVPVREYFPLKQATEGEIEEVGIENKELFILLMLEVMDKNGNLFVPDRTKEKLWGLACAARQIQELFGSGKAELLGTNSIKLESMNLSVRGLQAIIDNWKNEGMAYELDYYIYDYLISRRDVSAAERALFYNILYQKGFFAGDVWPRVDDMSIFDKITEGIFQVDAPKNEAGERKYIKIEETIEAIYGEIPQRVESEEDLEDIIDIEKMQIFTKTETELKTVEDEIGLLLETINLGGCELEGEDPNNLFKGKTGYDRYGGIDMNWINAESKLNLNNEIIKEFFGGKGVEVNALGTVDSRRGFFSGLFR